MPVTIDPPKYVAGDQCDVVVMLGTDPVSLPADKWTMTIKGMTKDMSNMRDGRKRIGGLIDAEGSFDLKYDLANDPTTEAKGKIRNGAVVDLKLYLGPYAASGPASPFYAVKAIIDDITPAAEFANEATISVKWSLESGTVTFPVYTT